MEVANKIFINRKFNCSSTELFDWLVRPELIAKWSGPKHLSVGMVESDLRIGGKYSIELIKSDDQNFFIEGKYIELKEPTKLVFSFRYRGLPSQPPDSIVKITIKSTSDSEAHLFLVQDFVTVPADMENRTKSWEYMFGVLEEEIPFPPSRNGA